MARITREGEIKDFWEYAIRYALVSRGNNYVLNPIQFPNIQWRVEIPAFQRGIVWKKDNISNLIKSQSKFFGTVIGVKKIINNNTDDVIFVLIDRIAKICNLDSITQHPISRSSC